MNYYFLIDSSDGTPVREHAAFGWTVCLFEEKEQAEAFIRQYYRLNQYVTVAEKFISFSKG